MAAKYEESPDGFDTFPKSPTSPPGQHSEDFLFETKYVMLNFMSLVPPDMYKGHISASPETPASALSNGDRFAKSHPYVVKSKSFDLSNLNRSCKNPKLKHIGKLKTFQRLIDPTASEDNLSYRYAQNSNLPDHMLLEERCHSVESPIFPTMRSPDFGKPPGSHLHHADSPISPQKSPVKFLERMYSDVSSSGDFTYHSDADDELTETSDASSVFSNSRGLLCREGFLDLRKSLHQQRMQTLASQSELEYDEVDGNVMAQGEELTEPLGVVSNETVAKESGDLSDSTDLEAYLNTSVQENNGNIAEATRLVADRSKLKLKIPAEPVQLDDILVSLQTQLTTEMTELESEFEDALMSARNEMASRSPRRTPLTPQSEAAQILARIGDEVKDQYDSQISEVVQRMLYHKLCEMTYSQFREIAQSVIDTSLPGWRQVALLLVFGQKVVWGAIEQGQKQFGGVFDHCTQLVAEVAAEFIIKEGGWSAVMNFDPSQSSDAQSSTDIDNSPDVLEYFSRHEITQVESEVFNVTSEEQTEHTATCRPTSESLVLVQNTSSVTIIERENVPINVVEAINTNDSMLYFSDINTASQTELVKDASAASHIIPNSEHQNLHSKGNQLDEFTGELNTGGQFSFNFIPDEQIDHSLLYSSGNRYTPSLGFDFREQSEGDVNDNSEAADNQESQDEVDNDDDTKQVFQENVEESVDILIPISEACDNDLKEHSINGIKEANNGIIYSQTEQKSEEYSNEDRDNACQKKSDNQKFTQNLQSAIPIQPDSRSITETDIPVSEQDLEVYGKDAVYVKQDTPVGVVQYTFENSVTDPEQNVDGLAEETFRTVTDNQTNEYSDAVVEEIGDSNIDILDGYQTNDDQKIESTDNNVAHVDTFDQAKQMGKTVLAVTLAVLTLGVAVKMATFKR